jgi:hypothetical protein
MQLCVASGGVVSMLALTSYMPQVRRMLSPTPKAISVNRDSSGNISLRGVEATDLFVDPDHGDFRLKPGSPAIGAGAPVPEVTTDIAGNPRSATPSIGAFEYTWPMTTAAPVTPAQSSISTFFQHFVILSTLLNFLANLVILRHFVSMKQRLKQCVQVSDIERLRKRKGTRRSRANNILETILDKQQAKAKTGGIS